MKIWNLGYPRIGRKRELKKSLEGYWSKTISQEKLLEEAGNLIDERWSRQIELGVESIPLNDFSFYDHMLDMSFLLGAIPKRYHGLKGLDQYFSMARGNTEKKLQALDMTKWFNSNYHYLVPELTESCSFELNLEKLNFELDRSKKFKKDFHVVLVGPVTYVKLSRLEGVTEEKVLEKILPQYEKLLKYLKSKSIQWVQMDEPILCTDLKKEDIRTMKRVYDTLKGQGPSIMLATYFDSPDPWLSEISTFAVDGIHLDMVSGEENWGWLKTKSFPKDKVLSLGLVSGRNIWATDLKPLLKPVGELVASQGEKLLLSPSSSLLHLPHDKSMERKWDPEFLTWVSFADQRIEELVLLKKALLNDKKAETQIEDDHTELLKKLKSPRIHVSSVKQAVERIDAKMKTRKSPFPNRIRSQMKRLGLSFLPTTTIGSFPQTDEIRKARLSFKSKQIDWEAYELFLKKEIERVVRLQEKLGLDILVHGECERNDMVEYFGEQLDGFTFSQYGWVQSYGSRCVKPPVIFGDVSRKKPMTVKWFQYAQSLTPSPMKGMLTGPVTILNWSFVREDQSREKTAYQIALAIRDEVKDLEASGAKVIQIDEAAIREGLPVKRKGWAKYLEWAVDSFRVCSSLVKDETQIHTHMCYSDFSDMMESIQKMDADVLLIEFARSGQEVMDTLKKNPYKNHVGPGVYDIHSPRVPSVEEMETHLRQMLTVLPVSQVWINPDCGLKTRKFAEVEPALLNMVASAKKVRSDYVKKTEKQPSVSNTQCKML